METLSNLECYFWKYYPIGKLLIVIASKTYWKIIYSTMKNNIKLEKFLLNLKACQHENVPA